MGGRRRASGCRPEDTENERRRREVNKLLCCLRFHHATFSGNISLQGQVLSSRGLCEQTSNGGKIQISHKMKVKKGFKVKEGSCRTN